MRDGRAAQEAHKALMASGFGDYEARAYCALSTETPANGCQMARRSGIPRTKVHERLGRLLARCPSRTAGDCGRLTCRRT